MDINSVPISTRNLTRIQNVYRREPTICMAVAVLKHHLLSSGFDLTRSKLTSGRKRKRETPDKDERTRWTVFLERALDQIICWGFIIFYEDLSEVDIERCRVTLNRVTREIKVEHISTPDSEARPIIVINAFGYSPNVDGTIVSIVHSLLPWINFIGSVRDTAMNIEEHKLNPELVYEKIPVKEKEEADVGMEYFGNIDDMGKKSEQTYETSREHRVDYAKAKNEDRQILARFAGEEQPQPTLESYVPDGHKLAHVLEPQARADTVGLMRMVQQLICGVIGVPRTMIINDSVARADTEATHSRFRNTVRVFRRHLNHVLTVAYNAVAADTGMYTVGHLRNLYYGPPETLTQMWLLGIIDEDTYRNIFATEYGVERADAPPLFTDDERRELARESIRNLVTQHHGRT